MAKGSPKQNEEELESQEKSTLATVLKRDQLRPDKDCYARFRIIVIAAPRFENLLLICTLRENEVPAQPWPGPARALGYSTPSNIGKYPCQE